MTAQNRGYHPPLLQQDITSLASPEGLSGSATERCVFFLNTWKSRWAPVTKTMSRASYVIPQGHQTPEVALPHHCPYHGIFCKSLMALLFLSSCSWNEWWFLASSSSNHRNWLCKKKLLWVQCMKCTGRSRPVSAASGQGALFQQSIACTKGIKELKTFICLKYA